MRRTPAILLFSGGGSVLKEFLFGPRWGRLVRLFAPPFEPGLEPGGATPVTLGNGPMQLCVGGSSSGQQLVPIVGSPGEAPVQQHPDLGIDVLVTVGDYCLNCPAPAVGERPRNRRSARRWLVSRGGAGEPAAAKAQ